MSTQASPEFGQCAQCVLDLLRVYLSEADELNIGHMQAAIAQFRGALEDGGMISVASDGAVRMMTPQAEALLTKYFPPLSEVGTLPLHLQKWLSYQVSQIVPGSHTANTVAVLNVELNSEQLTIRFIAAPHQENYLLLLEEKTLAVFSVTDLEALGLSTRRAEVLFWIAQDKSNAEIAKILDCSEGTVRKHVELIYKTLEVHTRAGSVIAALRQLGMLTG
jgi:DNA-binding CsgD family transcriptional regulator